MLKKIYAYNTWVKKCSVAMLFPTELIGDFPKWSRTFIEFSEYSEFGESEFFVLILYDLPTLC